MELSRRSFLRTAAAAAGSLVLRAPLQLWADSTEAVKILEPFHGAILNSRSGQKTAHGLKIRVTGQAPAQDRVTVNGQPTQRSGNLFSTDLVLTRKTTDITAISQGEQGKRKHHVTVLWDKHSFPRYRFSIDDNSFFLRDIAQQQYASLFDCFYLKLLRDLHRKYGTKFVLNIYYTTGDGFNLTQFPDRYHGEWKDNADWLKLAFHAYANDPDRPYQNAAPEKLAADFDLVAEQIHRFAGQASYTPPTVVHWAMVQPPALKVLHKRGVRVLSGFFWHRNNKWDINYQIDDARSEYLSRHDALMDFDNDIVFSKVDLVCNGTALPEIVPTLEKAAGDPNQAEVMDIFTHEQYFWPFYKNYLPDHGQRLDTALRWLTEHAYKPIFFHEGFFAPDHE